MLGLYGERYPKDAVFGHRKNLELGAKRPGFNPAVTQ